MRAALASLFLAGAIPFTFHPPLLPPWHPPRHTAVQAPQNLTYYDSENFYAIPPGVPVAAYANGLYAVSPAQVRGRKVLWFDVNGGDPYTAQVLDIENYDATPLTAERWVRAKLERLHDSVAVLYMNLDEWGNVKTAVATLPAWEQKRVRYWVANPTGVPHMVPGAAATQWEFGATYDISTVTPAIGG